MRLPFVWSQREIGESGSREGLLQAEAGGKIGLVLQVQQKLLLGLPTSYILIPQDQGAVCAGRGKGEGVKVS